MCISFLVQQASTECSESYTCVCIFVQIMVWTKQPFEIFSTHITKTDDNNWSFYKSKGLKYNIPENIQQIELFILCIIFT